MNDTTLTIVGNLTAAPELRFTANGAAVANFTIASTPRVRDGEGFKDGPPLFMRCALWREAAENMADSLDRGARVIATGRLKQRSYETNTGEKRTVVELEVDEIGPSLRYATATPIKTSRGGGKSASRPAAAGQGVDDPWGSTVPAADPDEIPF